jgi:hypothetical protein
MFASLRCNLPDERLAKRGQGKKDQENDASDDEIRYQRNALIDEASASLPGVGKIDGHAALLLLTSKPKGRARGRIAGPGAARHAGNP